ncbi:MAG: NADP-dependent oxidoreductase [Novosphingobium sp.]|nr:NADP-dependent oxidoreductase [Novosphingobium sp.]
MIADATDAASGSFTNPAIRVAGAPGGIPEASDFELCDAQATEPGPGEVLFRSLYMSIDPAMRRKMPSPVEAPAPLGGQIAVGDIMVAGQTPLEHPLFAGHAGEVIASRHPDFAPGDFVRGGSGWQTLHTSPGELLMKLDCERSELLDELGILGQPAFVAWCGMERVAQVQPGETFVISAAGGAIGMAAGQMAKIAGARVIGIASGEKADFVVNELGFDACIARDREPVEAALDRLCPDGIDVCFDNVGGNVQRACFDRLRDFGRLVVCGMAGEYNAPEADAGPPLRPVLRKRLTIKGFVVYDHIDLYPVFRERMAGWRRDGLFRYRYDIAEGLENAPGALIAVLEGRNRGKAVVRLARSAHDGL